MVSICEAVLWKYGAINIEALNNVITKWPDNAPVPKPTESEQLSLLLEYQKYYNNNIKEKVDRLHKYRKLTTTEEIVIALWDKIMENKPEAADSLRDILRQPEDSDAIQLIRLEIKKEIPKPTEDKI